MPSSLDAVPTPRDLLKFYEEERLKQGKLPKKHKGIPLTPEQIRARKKQKEKVKHQRYLRRHKK